MDAQDWRIIKLKRIEAIVEDEIFKSYEVKYLNSIVPRIEYKNTFKDLYQIAVHISNIPHKYLDYEDFTNQEKQTLNQLLDISKRYPITKP